MRSYSSEEILHAIEKQEKFREDMGVTQSQLIKADDGADKVEIAASTDLKNQADNIMGHKVAEGWHKVVDRALKPAALLSEMYDTFLSSYQKCKDAEERGRVIKSPISKKPFTSLTFDDYVNEQKKHCLWMKDEELPRLKKRGKMKKDAYELTMYINARNLEAIDIYLSALDSSKIGMV